jgi:rhodanese-related sulfurtransferase/uncharacterized RmlC-like cupin family protein
MRISRIAVPFLAFALGSCSTFNIAEADQKDSVPFIRQAVFSEPGSSVSEVSTAELEQILQNQSAVVLDTRPYPEWSVSHIPGALNVAPKPGVPIALYTSDVREVGRLVDGDKSRPLVVYCNGPYCGKSKRVADELLKAGYADVRRYQLGAPVWRALVGMMVIEPEGTRYVFKSDQTAVWIDARDASIFQKGSIRGARNLPQSAVLPGKDVGEVFAAKNDGRLPMEDHNTRIIVFGQDSEQARQVAAALVREAFHNVTYFAGTYEALKASMSASRQGYVLKPGQGEDTIGDGSSLIKASPKTGTQGVVFVEDTMPPSSTSGIHVHLEADEFFYVLEGTGRINLGVDEHEISAGDMIFVPVGTDHKISSSDGEPLHVIFVVDRPGLDEQFRLEFDGLDRTKMTIDEFNAIVEKYGTVYKTFD